VSKAKLIERLSVLPRPFDAAGVALTVRRMTAGERMAFIRDHNARGEARGEGFAGRLFAAAVCDDAGALLFHPVEADGYAWEVVEAVGEWVLEANRLGPGAGDPKAPAASPPTPS
jgi:hypothetical protein